MALNRLMHPRNQYKNSRPDFKKLAENFDILRKYADNSGRVHLDFKNPECLRALTWCLLKSDFDLDILLPPDRLIPTVPLRLNYILWLEDLISSSNNTVCGIDIGAGASCIYALLGARKNKWHFLTTEADATNVEVATKNVERNALQNFIEVRRVPDTALLGDVLTEADGHFDFCMCNPPFYGSSMEAWGMINTRTDNRPEPWSTSTASPQESVYPGGEVQFVKRMIEDSLELKDRVRIYTTMLGKKSSMAVLKAELRSQGITNFGTTEFCQGRTMRWGLGWSFDPSVVFPPPLRKQLVDKSVPRLMYTVPKPLQCTGYSLAEVKSFVRQCLQDIQMPLEVLKDEPDEFDVLVMPVENTWSHQRRKRREMKKTQVAAMGSAISTASEQAADQILMSPTKKVRADSSELSSNTQDSVVTIAGTNDQPAAGGTDLQVPNYDDQSASSKNASVEQQQCDDAAMLSDEKECLFTSRITLKFVDQDIAVEMHWLEGKNRELMHQVLQYIKNRLK